MDYLDHSAASSLNSTGSEFLRPPGRYSRRSRDSSAFFSDPNVDREPLLALEDSNRFSSSRGFGGSSSDGKADGVYSVDPSGSMLSTLRPSSGLVINGGHGRGLSGLSMSGDYVTIEEPLVGTPDNATTIALHKCKETVLQPYVRMLSLLGWHQILVDDGTKVAVRLINIAYPILVMLFIIFAYIVQYAACFKRDRPNYHNSTREVTCENHLVSIYIIPDILHSAAYIYAFYIFRLNENEQLVTLMERVYLQTSATQSGYLSQQHLTRRLRWLLRFNVGWVLITLVAQVTHVIGLHVGKESKYTSFTWIDAHGASAYFLAVLMIIGLLALNVVYATIVINYATQCELLVIMLRSISLKVRQKLVSLIDIMRELNEAQKYLKVVNEKVATAVSLLMFNFSTMFVLGIQSATEIQLSEPVFFASTILSIVLWFCILAMPVIQAARVSTAGWSVSKVGLEVASRPFGYQDTPQEEINAFLLYTSSLNIRAKLFRVPIQPRWLFGIFVLAAFTVLILSQLQVFS